MGQLFAGTSGFAYPGWKPAFYPAKLPAKRFLEYYAQHLNAVEINYTFRRLPSRATLESWVKATPDGFLFSVKANMRITHILRLKNASEAVETFLRAIDPLRSARRLGPILFQVPPQFRCDLPVLADFLTELPPGLQYAFEVRHASWLSDPVYELLSRHNVALCLAESEKFEVPHVITAGFVYFRLRKPEYAHEELHGIAEKAMDLLSSGKNLYLFFKHEENPQGALYAQQVLELTSQRRSSE